MRTYAYRGVRNVLFLEIWRALFFCYLRFEICLFALSPTISLYFQQPARIYHGPPPDSYMAFSILTCLFCFWPVSIAAIIKSSEVSSLLSV